MTIMSTYPESYPLRNIQDSKFKTGLSYTAIPYLKEENILDVNSFDGLDSGDLHLTTLSVEKRCQSLRYWGEEVMAAGGILTLRRQLLG